MGFTAAQTALLKSSGLSFLSDEFDRQDAEIAELTDAADATWILHSAALVFLMQTGFAMLCAGCVRSKNTKNILLKNVLGPRSRCARARRPTRAATNWPTRVGRRAAGRARESSHRRRISARRRTPLAPALRDAQLFPSRAHAKYLASPSPLTVRARQTAPPPAHAPADACAGALGFWSIGYAIAFGNANGGNPFIGNEYFFLVGIRTGRQLSHWFFQFGFAATAATIVSGAVAERTQMGAYIGYSTLLTMIVYPVCVHWQWSESGWLSPFNASTPKLLGTGMLDFAGCGCVHMLGGLSAILGAMVVGPRLGRYDSEGKVVEMQGHSSTLQVRARRPRLPCARWRARGGARLKRGARAPRPRPAAPPHLPRPCVRPGAGARHVHPVGRLVRLQPRFDDQHPRLHRGRGARGGHDDHLGGRRRDHDALDRQAVAAHLLAWRRDQRHARRPRQHHRRLLGH
jgi:hypothetical protein